MEMVAATKMRKATGAVVESKEYVKRAYELLVNLGNNQELKHELLNSPEGARKTLIVAISSNRGLCGAYNSNIRKAVAKYVESNPGDYGYIALGKYVEKTLKKLPGEFLASFSNLGDSISEEDLWAINTFVIDEYKKGEYKNVILFYTKFNNTLSYTPTPKHILPIREKDLEEVITEKEDGEAKVKVDNFSNYLFEPDSDEILDFILPRVIEVYIYQALLESLASEHTSRMIAMKSASDNAKKLIDTLTVGYNRARQAAITQEIAEISAGSSM